VRKAVGSMVLVALAIYLFTKGALVMRPRETTAALWALIAALMHACCGSSSTNDGTAFEERREGDLVSECDGHERGEGDVDPGVLDHAQVLGVKPRQFSGLLLGQFTLFSKLPKTKTEAFLSGSDRLLQGGTKPHLRRAMISCETLPNRHNTGLRHRKT